MLLVALLLNAVAAAESGTAIVAGEAAGNTTPLPEPLTLDDALRLAAPAHPAVMTALAEQRRAEAELARTRHEGLWDARIVAEPRLADRAAEPGHAFMDDSRAGLVMSRRLSDFGRSDALAEAGRLAVSGSVTALEARRRLRLVEVMGHFLDVLLADLRFAADDEDMTVRFLQFDRLRERAERFEEFSEVDLLALESAYRDAYVRRARSEAGQRLARVALALAMARPGTLASTLVRPELAVYERPLPEFGELLAEALEHSPALIEARQAADEARALVAAAEAFAGPELRAGMEAAAWSKEVGSSRDSFRAIVSLEIPLAGRGLRAAEVGLAQADLLEREAGVRSVEHVLRQRLRELVEELLILDAERLAAEVGERYRDRQFDRSRSLYEMEVRVDLGDAQARMAEALWRSARVEFAIAMTWAEIDTLLGRPLAVLER